MYREHHKIFSPCGYCTKVSFEKAFQVKERNKLQIMLKKGVQGVGITKDELSDDAIVAVMISDEYRGDLPEKIDGVNIKVVRTGTSKRVFWFQICRQISRCCR